MTPRRPRVLVVEDNPLNLELVRDLLDVLGIDVQEAATAEAGIRMATEAPPDLILMDIRLPGLDGHEAVRLLKTDDRVADVPVVALTAQAMKGDEEEARAAGFDDYMTKPIDVEAFPAVIERHLRRAATDG